MGPILIFGGTKEGRELSVCLAQKGHPVTVCVATGYGSEVLPALSSLTVHVGRLDAAQMEAFVKDYALVIDATHPYADLVSDNIGKACGRAGIRHIRLLRPSLDIKDVTGCADAKAAALFLTNTEGNILLTTGSKNLADFTAVLATDRLYVRVIPSPDSLRACLEQGIPPSHVICMQGPFSKELNLAMLRDIRAKYLVTKDSGAPGGLPEKLAAAKEAGVSVVLIDRPVKEEGVTLRELLALFDKEITL